MPTLTINELAVSVPEGATVLQAVRLAGAPLPTLCHWDGLPPVRRVPALPGGGVAGRRSLADRRCLHPSG